MMPIMEIRLISRLHSMATLVVLVFLQSHFLIQDSQGFVPDNIAHACKSTVTDKRRSVLLAMDPYESQYQKYCQSTLPAAGSTSDKDASMQQSQQSQRTDSVVSDDWSTTLPVAADQKMRVEHISNNSNDISNNMPQQEPVTRREEQPNFQEESQETPSFVTADQKMRLEQYLADNSKQQQELVARREHERSLQKKSQETALFTVDQKMRSEQYLADNSGQQQLVIGQEEQRGLQEEFQAMTPPVDSNLDNNNNSNINMQYQGPVTQQEDQPKSQEVSQETLVVAADQKNSMKPYQDNMQHQQPVTPYEEQPNSKADDRSLNRVASEVRLDQALDENPYTIADIPLGIMVQRVVDLLETSTQKRNGKIKGQSKLKGQTTPKEIRPTVAVLGTGWAAHAFIQMASTYDLRVVVISPVNHFVFTPMLASASVGTIEYRSMTEAIRVTNPYIDNYVEGSAIGVDPTNKMLTVQLTSLSTVTGSFKGIAANGPNRLEPEPPIVTSNADSNSASQIIQLSYDYLICAVGTGARSNIVPGAKEHCFNLKTSQDSKRLRTAIGEALEYASRPDVQETYYTGDIQKQQVATIERKRRVRFVIVGGGATGVELAGELSDFFSEVTRYSDGAFQRLGEDISIMIVHSGSELIPGMDRDLRQRALEALESQGVEVRLNTRLKEVGKDFVRLGEKGSDEVETIPVCLTVWGAGNEPVPFVSELLRQLPEGAAGSAGCVNVDRWLRCLTPTPETFGSILVLGDVANLKSNSKYDTSSSNLPQTAQVAGQQGAYAARMLNRGYDLKKTPPELPDEVDEFSLLRVWLLARSLQVAPEFSFLSLGLLAYVGGGKALNQVQIGDVPIVNYYGEVAFALWRSVYLTKQASTKNQALIAFDWLRTEAFGRDITRL